MSRNLPTSHPSTFLVALCGSFTVHQSLGPWGPVPWRGGSSGDTLGVSCDTPITSISRQVKRTPLVRSGEWIVGRDALNLRGSRGTSTEVAESVSRPVELERWVKKGGQHKKQRRAHEVTGEGGKVQAGVCACSYNVWPYFGPSNPNLAKIDKFQPPR